MSGLNINKTRISVVTKPTHVSVSSVGVRGKAGETQDLSNYAILDGSNSFIGNQFISGGIEVNNITFVDGDNATIEKIPIASEIYYATYTLVNIEGYSTGSTDTLPSSSFNTPNDIPHPWTAFYLDAGNGTAVSSIIAGDILAGVSIIPSQVQTRGGSGFGNVVILNLDLSAYDDVILPVTGSKFTLVRPVTKQALEIKAEGNTDIFFNPMGSGSVITNKSFIPSVSNQIDLGLSTRRWRELWIGSGSIYVQDETLAIDHKLTARDGDFVIEGSAGLQVGQFTFHDNYIKIKDSARDIEFGVEDATGYINFNRPFAIKSLLTGRTTFNATREGRVQIITPNIPAGDVGALSIIGNASGSYQPVINPSGMLHITSNDGQAARVTVDGFGSSIGAIFVGRHARGTAALPTPTLSGDILARFSGLGYSTSSYFPVVEAVPTSLEFQATENYSTSGAGSRAAFYTYANGATNRTLSAVIDTNGLILPNVPTNETENEILVWDSVTGRVGKQNGVSAIDGGAAASIFILSTEVLNGGGA